MKANYGIDDTHTCIKIDDIILQLKMAKFCSSLTRYQRSGFSMILQMITRKLYDQTHSNINKKNDVSNQNVNIHQSSMTVPTQNQDTHIQTSSTFQKNFQPPVISHNPSVPTQIIQPSSTPSTVPTSNTYTNQKQNKLL